MAFTALLDANVLYPAPLRDLLLQLTTAKDVARLQHFSTHIGHRNTGRINPGDPLVIYWPGRSVYMALSEEIGLCWRDEPCSVC